MFSSAAGSCPQRPGTSGLARDDLNPVWCRTRPIMVPAFGRSGSGLSVRIIYYAAASIDGFIATDEGGVGWLDPFNDRGEDYGFADFSASIDGVVMGSRTYEFALRHDPWMLPETPSWVFTKRELPVAHPSVSLTSEDPETVVAALASANHRRLWLMGGSRLAGSFEECGLISDYIFSMVPVELGSGIPLFSREGAGGGTDGSGAMELIKTQVFPNGVLQLSYRNLGQSLGRSGGALESPEPTAG